MTDEERVRNVAAVMMAIVGVSLNRDDEGIFFHDLLIDPKETLDAALECFNNGRDVDELFLEMARVLLGIEEPEIVPVLQ